MKVGIKLHNHKSNGPIDTYHIKKSPYTADYHQGCQILQAIHRYQNRVSPHCIAHLATFVTESWENNASPDSVDNLHQFMNHLLDTTGIQDNNLSLDESIQQVCANKSPVPTVYPSMTLLFAVRYIERLKQRYGNIQGANGCGRRLVLVAYIIAAKYIQSNLKFIVNATDLPPLKKHQSVSSQHPALPTMQSEQLLSSPLPVSPPVSPKIPERTDPSHYHYFYSVKPPTVKEQAHEMHTTATLPSLSSMCTEFNYHIWRMENEFLHFLNGNVKVPDCFRLMDWATNP